MGFVNPCRRIRPLILLSLMAVWFCGTVAAQEQYINGRPFPLPRREVRLEQEALRPETSVTRLLELLREEGERVPLAAARVLARRALREEIPNLLQSLEPLATRSGALQAAVKLALEMRHYRGQKTEAVVTAMQPWLASRDSDENVEAILILWHVRTPRANDALMQFMAQTSGWQLSRCLALLKLAERRDRRVLPFIEDMIIMTQHTLQPGTRWGKGEGSFRRRR